MKKNCKLQKLFLVCSLITVVFLTQAVSAFAASATIQLSSTTAQLNDIITAYVNVDNIDTISGTQFNIVYDPNVLQLVDPYTGVAYNDSTAPLDGNILINLDYSIFDYADNDVSNGVINYSKCYLNLASYKGDNNPESTGTVAIIGFKVISSNTTTSIQFQDTAFMPNAITGTYFFDWDGNKVTGYTVNQPSSITIQ